MSYYYLKEVDFMKLMVKIIAIIIGALGVFVAGGTVVACSLFEVGAIDIPRVKEISSYVQRYGYRKAAKHFDKVN